MVCATFVILTVEMIMKNLWTLSRSRLSRTGVICLGIIFIFLSTASFAAIAASISSPTPGTVLPGTSVTFKWSGGSGIADYRLYVGTAYGTWNIYSADVKTNTSAPVTGFPSDGKPVYVTLVSVPRYGRSMSHTYTYTDPGTVASKISVSIAPTTVSLATGGSQSLTATVSGATNTGVTWNATGGTISGTGNTVSYTAPTTAGTYTVTATSVADTSKSAAATITVTAATQQVGISVSPASVSLATGGAQSFVAAVTGTTNTSVSWSASGGTLTPSGNTAQYTAPSTVGTYTIKATSAADSSKSATATVTVTSATQSACAAMSLGQTASLNGARVFPASNAWNQDISGAAVDANSPAIINYIGASTTLHADFGSGTWDGAPIGQPYVIVDSSQPKVNVTITDYPSESDIPPMPIPSNAPIEGYPNPGDNHVIVLDKSSCFEYELYLGSYNNGSWSAGQSTIWDLQNGEMRPYTWTSADAAGLPIFPGLARYDEVASGAINHAIRFTAPKTKAAFLAPAMHLAATDSSSPIPMGMRLRLKASYDVSGFSTTNQVILNAMKKYGLMLADNGSAIYLGGTPDSRWDNNDLHQLSNITASNFEVVSMGTQYTSSNIPQGAAPSISSFSASASSVAKGTPVTLSWTVSGASYIYISPVVGPVRGSSVTFSPTASASYMLTATNQYGRNTATVTVDVQ